jgi:hypothetical protein
MPAMPSTPGGPGAPGLHVFVFAKVDAEPPVAVLTAEFVAVVRLALLTADTYEGVAVV